ncbi:MAG: hypothetical protein V7K67_23800 [Nostoc sp.]|uniref:hypothetical protein n=1 Tax=Nostoc sp. TaxID=1180 RepID=UPI002FF6DE75
MSGVIKRRQFIQATLAATASIAVPSIASATYHGEECLEALIIGSGFGGAVAALRLGEAGIKTMLIGISFDKKSRVRRFLPRSQVKFTTVLTVVPKIA